MDFMTHANREALVNIKQVIQGATATTVEFAKSTWTEIVNFVASAKMVLKV